MDWTEHNAEMREKLDTFKRAMLTDIVGKLSQNARDRFLNRIFPDGIKGEDIEPAYDLCLRTLIGKEIGGTGMKVDIKRKWKYEVPCSCPASDPQITVTTEEQGHCGDCTIYGSKENGRHYDGFCTCGYGLSVLRKTGDDKEMTAAWVKETMERMWNDIKDACHGTGRSER